MTLSITNFSGEGGVQPTIRHQKKIASVCFYLLPQLSPGIVLLPPVNVNRADAPAAIISGQFVHLQAVSFGTSLDRAVILLVTC